MSGLTTVPAGAITLIGAREAVAVGHIRAA